MRNINDGLEQIIENLLFIKNNRTVFSQIEKDILLQNLRDAYLLISRTPSSDSIEDAESQEETKETAAQEVVFEARPMVEMKANEEEDKVIETPIAATVIDEKPIETQIDFEPEPMYEPEVELISEPAPELISETEQELIPEPEISMEKEDEPESESEQEDKEEMDTDILEFIEVAQPKPEIATEPKQEPETKPETISEPQQKPESKPEIISKPQQEPELEKIAESPNQPQPVSVPVTQTLFEEELPQKPVKPQQRSLNDLFNEQKQDLGDKFQQTKITDLTKAMSINDKFLFIRELFKNKSEEFSRAIHTLNGCENIEEAFDIMEGLKKQYFWDSTSSAYLALCDLVRRKF